MKVRASTVLLAIALAALGVSVLLFSLSKRPGFTELDTAGAALYFAVFPLMALAGAVATVVILFSDRSRLRFVELAVSILLMVFLFKWWEVP